MQCETAKDDSVSSRFAMGMYSVFDVSHLESKIAYLQNMLKGLSVQISQISRTFMVSYSHC